MNEDNRFSDDSGEEYEDAEFRETGRALTRREPAQGGSYGIMSAEAVADLEKSVQHLKRAVVACVSMTNEKDWRKLGEYWYPEASACAKVGRLMGVCFHDHEVTTERFRNGAGQLVTRYICKVLATGPGGAETIEEGIAATDDDFFSRGGKIPPEEVDHANVRKKAITNAHNRAIRRMCMLDKLDDADLQKAGLNLGKVGRVAYDGSSKAKKEASASPDGAERARKELEEKLEDLAMWYSEEGEACTPQQLLEEATTFEGKDGKPVSAKSIEKMGDKWVGATLGKIRKVWNEHPRNGGQS